jgi:hypothetical protein
MLSSSTSSSQTIGWTSSSQNETEHPQTPHPNAHLALAFCLRCQPQALYRTVQLVEMGFMLSALGGGAVGTQIVVARSLLHEYLVQPCEDV